jgi:hypothetical protein
MYTTMASQNSSFVPTVAFAESFPVVYAYASGAGDTAYLYGTDGLFSYVATPTYAYVSGTNPSTFFDEAVGFGTVYGYSPGGSGSGFAYLSDSTGTGTFVGTSSYSTFSGNGFANWAVGFAYVQATDNSCQDTAWLYDSPGSNAFTGSGSDANLSSSITLLDANRFKNVNAVQSQGTNDTKHIGAIDYALTFYGSWTAV